MDRFEEFLKSFGQAINVPLHPDKHRACLLNINNVLRVQLEFDEQKDRILIATFITEVSAGKFRENILREALKANSIYPRIGTLAYSERNNQLSLFEYAYFPYITTEKMASLLSLFIQRADSWRTAIQSGHPAPSGEMTTKSAPFI
jgi:hypothetical protein